MKTVTRLYTQFQPSHYDVTFDIDEKAMHFSGVVLVKGKKIGRPSQRITLHQHGLKVIAASLVKHDKKGDQPIEVIRINNQDSLDEVRLHTETMLYPGDYTVTATFEAPITRGMTGIYPCYFKEDDTEKMLFATQFESHHAREAFPCIDEPEAKATFDMTIKTQQNVEVLGNTPIKTQRNEDDRLVTTFNTTPKMSSYLLAFVTGDMHKKTTTTKSGVEVNVWATTAQPANSLDFSLEVAKKSIEFFEHYFGIAYPLPKADHVALPDFSSGAMENWGLITYRERVLLAYPNETAQSVFEQIALVIAHETSHQWFGNLVTMKWWDDLWLNESFANMMEYAAIDSMYPEWHVWDSFVAAEGLSSLRRDAVSGVQAVKSEVHHPDEISSLFDPSIVYAKGGRLLYMLKNYIGDESFRKGLTNYFETHKYGNTTGSDLWASLSEVSGKDIAAFMNPWLTRSGFPLVTITQNESGVTISQEQFLDDPVKADKQRLWPVPTFANDLGVFESFTTREISFKPSGLDTVMIDLEAKGHYIVRYGTDHQKKAVMAKVASQELSTPDRLMLLNGGSMMARAGYEPFGGILTMLSSYTTEASEPVWDIIGLVLGESRRFIDQDASLEAKIKTFINLLVTNQYTRLGWEEKNNESSADQKLRALIIGLSGYAENEEVINRTKEMFTAYKDDATTLPPELRSIIFAVQVKRGDDEAFDFLLDLHDKTTNSDLQGDACDGLTATRNVAKAQLLLDRIKDATVVKPQDADRWLVYLLRNRYTRSTAWDWMVENWQWLEETFKNDKSYDYLPRYAASCVNTREYQQKYKDLFESKVDQLLLKRNITLGLEEIENRVTWLERDLTSVQNFFNQQ